MVRPSRSVVSILSALSAAALGTSCNATAPPPIASEPAEAGAAAPAPGLPPLPASFSGVLPCADCEGIRYQLDLRPNEVYFLRRIYLGAGKRAAFDDVGRWSLASDGQVLVLRGGREAPEMFSVVSAELLRKRDLEGREIESDLPYDLAREASYAPLAPRLRLRGMFTYLVDAAVFVECESGLSLPVAMAEEYLALERAYLEADGGAPMLALVAARIEPRPRMEGEGTVESLVVERFERLAPGETCGAGGATAELVGTTWTLVLLGAESVVVAEGGQEPHLILDAEGRVQGSGGCNRLMGGYATAGADLTFTPLAMTRMACPDGADVEPRFVAALEATRRWRILGRQLELYDDGGELLARLEARTLP